MAEDIGKQISFTQKQISRRKRSESGDRNREYFALK